LKTTLDSSPDVSFVPNHIARRVGAEVQRRIDALKIGQKMQDLPEELWHKSFRFYVKEDPTRVGGPNLRMIRLDPSQPSLTVTAYIFNKFVHPYENRFITVCEAARLQGFPDEIEFRGTLTNTQLQVGNAVPVQLSRAIFESLYQQAKVFGFKGNLKALSLFSGAGGMDIGAEQTTGISTLVSLDNWKDACDTLRGFLKHKTNVVERDITLVSEPVRFWKHESETDNSPDLLYGGPPCQAFSQAGKQKGLEDSRGKMIFEFLRFVDSLSPAFFVMENVSNLKGVAGGKLYKQIIEKIDSLGYNCTVDLLLSADFGTPQLRRRLIFLGSKKEIGKIKMPVPTHNAKTENLTLFDVMPYTTTGEAFLNLTQASYSNVNMIQKI